MLNSKEAGISSSHLDLWLVYAFPLFFSLRASSPIWVSETSLARTRSREGQRKGELTTIPYKFSFVLRPDEGKYHRLKNDVPEIKVD